MVVDVRVDGVVVTHKEVVAMAVVVMEVVVADTEAEEDIVVEVMEPQLLACLALFMSLLVVVVVAEGMAADMAGDGEEDMVEEAVVVAVVCVVKVEIGRRSDLLFVYKFFFCNKIKYY